jgi:hypothetical protein
MLHQQQCIDVVPKVKPQIHPASAKENKVGVGSFVQRRSDELCGPSHARRRAFAYR